MSDNDRDWHGVYSYSPSFALCIVGAVLYLIPTAFLFYQTCTRYRSWYLLCLPIGGLLEVTGYILRAVSVKNVKVVSFYAASLSLIVIAPLFVAAANYMLLGRLMRAVLPRHAQKILSIKPTIVTKLFVGLDILSFLIQVSGSGIASSNEWKGKELDIGVNVLITGLSTQLATILVFMVLLGVFAKRAWWNRGAGEAAPKGWERVMCAVMVSITLVAIRSVYRLVEFAVGPDGYLFSHEWCFYVLEALPMVPAFAVFCVWYPARYLNRKSMNTYGSSLEEEMK